MPMKNVKFVKDIEKPVSFKEGDTWTCTVEMAEMLEKRRVARIVPEKTEKRKAAKAR